MNAQQCTGTVRHILCLTIIEYFLNGVCLCKKWHKDVQQSSHSWACSLEAESLQEVKVILTGIIREIFCGVYCTLVPLDVSFLFLLARRRGLCYASAKPNIQVFKLCLKVLFFFLPAMWAFLYTCILLQPCKQFAIFLFATHKDWTHNRWGYALQTAKKPK